MCGNADARDRVAPPFRVASLVSTTWPNAAASAPTLEGAANRGFRAVWSRRLLSGSPRKLYLEQCRDVVETENCRPVLSRALGVPQALKLDLKFNVDLGQNRRACGRIWEPARGGLFGLRCCGGGRTLAYDLEDGFFVKSARNSAHPHDDFCAKSTLTGLLNSGEADEARPFVSLWILTATMVCSAQTTFYFPHIANGVLGGTIWKTTVLLTNPSASGAASGTISTRIIRMPAWLVRPSMSVSLTRSARPRRGPSRFPLPPAIRRNMFRRGRVGILQALARSLRVLERWRGRPCFRSST